MPDEQRLFCSLTHTGQCCTMCASVQLLVSRAGMVYNCNTRCIENGQDKNSGDRGQLAARSGRHNPKEYAK